MVDDDLAIIQEVLDSGPAVQALGFPVSVKVAIEAIRALRRMAPGDDAAGICKAWNGLAGALGPRLTAALLSGPEWRSFCPLSRPLDDYDSSDHTQVVWIGSERRIVAQAVLDGEQFVGLKFTAEPL